VDKHDQIEECNDKFIKESKVSFFNFSESHDPLDIPFGYEVGTQEKQMGVKDSNVGGPEDVEEGGLGSGRNPEGAGDTGGGQPGPLMSFETVSVPGSASAISIGAKRPDIKETITKQLLDAKLNSKCPCSKNKK